VLTIITTITLLFGEPGGNRTHADGLKARQSSQHDKPVLKTGTYDPGR
jgi:hypothetical protein